jgi:MOSC domain-containing protein
VSLGQEWGGALAARLASVNVGLPRDIAWRGKTVHTGIWKNPVQGRVMVRRLNIDGDGQGDLAGHGGLNRPVTVYQTDSCSYWGRESDRNNFSHGQFGENLTIDGLPDAGGSEAYKKAKRQAELPDQTAVSPDLRIRIDCKHPPALAGFYSRQVSPGVLFQVTNGVERSGGVYPESYLAPMEKVEENGLTFYRFEAQGRMQLDLETVNHCYLTDELQGTQADFFRAVDAPSPFPFFRDPQRKHVPVIQVAYAGIGLGPDMRDIFMRLLRQVRSR